MKTLAPAVIMTFAAVAAQSVLARTVEVASFDPSGGSVSLAFGEDAEGSLLYAVADTADRGTEDAELWKTATYLGTVAGDVTAGDYTLPGAWLENPCVIRFVLTTVHERPYDRAIEYLVTNSSGSSTPVGAYIDTGLVPDATTAVEATFVQRTGDAASFGVTGQFYLFSNASKTFYGFGGTSGSFGNFNVDNNRAYTLRLGPDGAYVDGVRKVGPFRTAAVSPSSTLTIGARREDGSQTVNKVGFFRLYGAKVFQNGRTVRDYEPVVKNGVGYFYDRVGRQLVAPTGTGTFGVADAAKDKGSDFPTDVTGWSDAVRLGRSVAVTALDGNTGAATVGLSGPAWSGRLFVVHDATDKGTDPQAWADCVFLDRVAAETTSYETSLKSEWLSSGGVVRFVWVSDIESPFDGPMSALSAPEGVKTCVDTGIVPNLETKVKAHVWMANSVGDCAFGVSDICYLFVPWAKGEDYYYGFQSANGSSWTGKANGTWRTLTIGPDGAMVDDAVVASAFGSATNVTAYWSLLLFGRRNNDTGATEKNEGLRSLRRVQIWDRGRRVRDYVACKKDGNPYFYERVSGAYVTGTGLAAGNDLVPEIAGEEPWAVSDAAVISGLKTATWDGGAADARLTSAANWVGDTTPDLADGTLVATFAAGGASAQVDANANLAGLVFDSSGDFAIGATGGGTLALGAAGIVLRPNAANLEISAPLTIAADQGWSGVGGRQGRVNVKAPIAGDAGRVLTVESTTVGLYEGSPDYRGTFAFGNGAIAKFFATENLFGDPSVGTPVTIRMENGVQMDFFAVNVDRPLDVTTGVGGGGFIFHPNVAGTANATRFTQPVAVGGGTDFGLGVGSCSVTLSGGLTSDPVVAVNGGGNGALRFTGRPIVVQKTLSLRSDGYTVSFEVASNDVAAIELKGKRIRLNFTVDNAAYWSSRNGVISAPDLTVTSNSVVDVKGTYQTFDPMTLPETATLTGTTGSVCRVIFYGNTRWKGLVTGAVTLSKGGPMALHLDAANTSTGDLVCNSGTVRISATGSWAGRTVALTAESKGERLGLAHSNALSNGRRATLALNGPAQVRVDEGVSQTVRILTIDGREASAGTWGSSSSAAEFKDDEHFTGTGVVNVKGGGAVLLVR